jgi:exodeoxyribonuclease VII small subunit
MTKNTDPNLTFEEALISLEKLVDQLESGDVALEEAISLYTKGEKLKSFCELKLKEAEEKISKIIIDKDSKNPSISSIEEAL